MRKKKSRVQIDPGSKGLNLFFPLKRTLSTPPVAPRPPTPKKPRNPLDYQLWSSSSLIPFFETDIFEKVDSWISSFSQSRPCCILYGPTSSGKSRIIEQISVKHCLHVIEIDCASVKDVKRCVDESNEATQSRSVGAFSAYQDRTPNSLVVFEHLDDLITSSERIPANIVSLLSSARVPILITANNNPFKPEQWLYPVFVTKPDFCIDILMGAVWMKNECRDEWTDYITKLLFMTYGDIRKTALQMMCMRNSNNFLPRDEQIYHTIPIYIEEQTETSEIDTELYALLMDNLCINDPNDLYFDHVARSDLVFQPFGHQEQEMREKAKILHKKIPHSRTTYMEDAEILEIGTIAAQNAVMKTRTMKQMPIEGVQFTSNEIEDIAFWYLFE